MWRIKLICTRAFCCITDFGANCEKCRTVNTVNTVLGELKKTGTVIASFAPMRLNRRNRYYQSDAV